MLPAVEIISILLAALVTGVFWGPWVGLTVSIASFGPEAFLAIGHRLNKNLGRVMTILMPAALLSIVAVLVLSFRVAPRTFLLSAAALVLFLVTLLVTILVEVPIAKRIASWSMDTMPADWREQRDKWARFHLLRVLAGILGLVLLVAGAVLR